MKRIVYIIFATALLAFSLCAISAASEELTSSSNIVETIAFVHIIRQPDGSLRFGLKFSDGRLYFSRLNDTVRGFHLVSYERTDPPRPITITAQPKDELTIEKNGRSIILLRGQTYTNETGIAQQTSGGDGLKPAPQK